MVQFSKFVALILAGTCLCVLGCTLPVRTGYDRKTGAYKPAPAATEAASAAGASNATGGETGIKQDQPRREPQNAAAKQTSAGNTKRAATTKMAQENAPRPSSNSSLEQLAKSWVGTPYVYGGSSRSGTDCSGYVMQIYKAHYGISLPHNAGQMYDDSRGSSVSRGSLQEGDLVFFGSFWKIDHVGIYLKGDRFTHASSSKGVIISSMSDNYWRPKYQGARRFR
jgi:lipoprotein Spr